MRIGEQDEVPRGREVDTELSWIKQRAENETETETHVKHGEIKISRAVFATNGLSIHIVGRFYINVNILCLYSIYVCSNFACPNEIKPSFLFCDFFSPSSFLTLFDSLAGMVITDKRHECERAKKKVRLQNSGMHMNDLWKLLARISRISRQIINNRSDDLMGCLVFNVSISVEIKIVFTVSPISRRPCT